MNGGITSTSFTKLLLPTPLAYTRDYCTVDARCDAIELRYQTEEEELDPYEYPWLEDEEWDRLDDERSDIENELDELFNTVIGFDYEHDPFKK